MNIEYDQALDILRVLFSDVEIAESDEIQPGVIVDYDEEGKIVGIEVLSASTRIEHRVEMIPSLRAS